MSSWRLWLLWFVLLLWDVRPTDTINVYQGLQGGERLVRCWSGKNVTVTRRIFCKNDCEEGDILVQTSGSRQTNGRFSIKHDKKGSPPKDYIYVTISNLTLSDSGRYRCFWDSPVRSSHREFMIEVTDVLLDPRPTDTTVSVYTGLQGGERLVRCWSGKNVNVTRRIFCKNDCEEGDILVQTSGSQQTNGRFGIEHEIKGSPPQDFIRVTISNLTLSDSGRYRCFWDSPEESSYREFMIEVTDDVDAEPKHELSLAAGKDFHKTLSFSKLGKSKTFCRNSCSRFRKDILVETTGDEGQSGRYRIQYKKLAGDLSKVTVTIRNVSSADSGFYQVHLDQSSRQVWINVSSVTSEAPPEQETTGRPGGAPNTQNLTMILVLIPVCVVVIIVTVVTLTVCKRRKRSDQGTGAGGAQSPEREYGNGYKNLCLEDVKPSPSELNKIEVLRPK